MHRLLTGSLSVDRLTIPIADLPPDLDGTTIVQLSDLHYDSKRLSDNLLQQAIEATNQASPDLIVLTGDFVTDDPAQIYPLVLQLKYLQSRAGVCAVLGNHDLYRCSSRSTITDALSSIDIDVLWDDIIYPLGEGLAIVGLPEYWSPDFRASRILDRIPSTVPRIVLAHNPDSAEALQQWRVDLQLSGHTHGGQIVIPGVGNISALSANLYSRLPTRTRNRVPFLRACYRVMKHWEWSKGFYQIGNNRLYVNRGLGTYFPGRLFCPPEVTVITLRACQNTAA
ncbi:metallophosphoesterase [Phormidesmis priestleyi]|uniref:metallophosphoesterase n=1 Tax=Phormidesmis priestleyi TaxID=268141 RepID=UPI00083A5F22|nr:metallophosphoesterase [Phormidesmis priestleyi]